MAEGRGDVQRTLPRKRHDGVRSTTFGEPQGEDDEEAFDVKRTVPQPCPASDRRAQPPRAALVGDSRSRPGQS